MKNASILDHPSYNPAIPAREAAKYLGIHVKTLIIRVKEGKLPVIRSDGNRLSFRLSALNSYLDSMEGKK